MTRATCPHCEGEYAAHCLGDGHQPCDWTHVGHGFNAAAEKHTATGHVTTTATHGGPFDRARTAA